MLEVVGHWIRKWCVCLCVVQINALFLIIFYCSICVHSALRQMRAALLLPAVITGLWAHRHEHTLQSYSHTLVSTRYSVQMVPSTLVTIHTLHNSIFVTMCFLFFFIKEGKKCVKKILWPKNTFVFLWMINLNIYFVKKKKKSFSVILNQE